MAPVSCRVRSEEPDVERDPEPGQGLADPVQHAAERPVGDGRPALGRVEVGQGLALLGQQLAAESAT
jgi:hypothetical protein